MAMGCLPQKAELNYLIPTIRKELAIALSKDMPDKEVAMKLGVTKAAISQYLHKKRASGITLPTELKKQIKISAQAIQMEKSTVMQEISNLLELSMETKFTCKLCKEHCK